jgi:hypothetical protein
LILAESGLWIYKEWQDGRKEGDIDSLCTLIVPLIGPGVPLFPLISAFAVLGIGTSPDDLLSVTVCHRALPNVRTWFGVRQESVIIWQKISSRVRIRFDLGFIPTLGLTI